MERIIQWIDLWDDSIDTMVFSYGACSVNIPYKGFPADVPFIQIWEINDEMQMIANAWAHTMHHVIHRIHSIERSKKNTRFLKISPTAPCPKPSANWSFTQLGLRQ